MRLRPWRTSPSSSEEEEGVDSDGATPTPAPPVDTTTPEDEEEEEVGTSTRLHPSITREHRGPLPWKHPQQREMMVEQID